MVSWGGLGVLAPPGNSVTRALPPGGGLGGFAPQGICVNYSCLAPHFFSSEFFRPNFFVQIFSSEFFRPNFFRPNFLTENFFGCRRGGRGCCGRKMRNAKSISCEKYLDAPLFTISTGDNIGDALNLALAVLKY